jgi:hypothetical protein
MNFAERLERHFEFPKQTAKPEKPIHFSFSRRFFTDGVFSLPVAGRSPEIFIFKARARREKQSTISLLEPFSPSGQGVCFRAEEFLERFWTPVSQAESEVYGHTGAGRIFF